MNKQQAHAILHIVGKIDLFKGLPAEEVERLLHICHFVSYDKDQEVFKAGVPSDEMLIVLQGRLTPRSPSGTVLGEIHAGTCCGEMGLFTGAARTVTVVAEEATFGFTVTARISRSSSVPTRACTYKSCRTC